MATTINETILGEIKRISYPGRDAWFTELFDVCDCTVDEFKNALLELRRERKIRLTLWSGAISNCPNEELIIWCEGSQERKFFARLA